jgi:membrane associated rhomboid family serine protease
MRAPLSKQEHGVRAQREKIFNIPFVVVALVVLLVAIHALREFLSDELNAEIIANLAFVPGRFTFAFDPDRIAAALDAARAAGNSDVELERLLLGNGQPLWWTPITYALLHASWAHVGLNCLWLVPFGAAVARRFGNLRFLLFCVATAIAGALVHFLTHMDDLQPVIGASAIVSGTMGAALRFVFQPGAPLGESLGLRDPRQEHLTYRLPALSLAAVLRNRTAMVFLIVWFMTNFLFGVGSGPLGFADSTIAWQAHIGGFLLGLFGFPLFDPPPAHAEAPPQTAPPRIEE